jgi:cardiolipin synthase A/B
MLDEATGGNRALLFDDGARLLAAVAEAIDGARERVWVETFLFTPDETGRRALQLLTDAARRGCDVILLFDQLGSHVTNLGFFRPVEEAGGRVAIFNPLPPWRRWGRALGRFGRYRDHRKVVVTDDVAFCGGHNFSTGYMGPPPHHFYDMTVRLEGPCVAELARLFLDSFTHATGETRPPPRPAAATGAPLPGVPVRVLAHDPHFRGTGRPAAPGRPAGDLLAAYTHLLDTAREDVLLVMAYFIPDATLRAPLLRAAARGVTVRALTAGKVDFPTIRWAGQYTYDGLLAAGIRIHQLQEPALHAKALVVDGALCMVGTFDVNTLERRNTAEAAVLIRDPALATAIADGYAACLPRSREVTLAERRQRSRLMRAVEWAAYRSKRV